MARRFDRIGWAMAQDGLTSTQKVVLIVVADAANEDQGVCWVKHNTIAERASLSERAVRYALIDLADKGLMRIGTRKDRRGRQTSNHYQLGCYEPATDIDWDLHEGGTTCQVEGGTTCQEEAAPRAGSIVNQPEGTGLQNSRKTSSSSARRGRAAKPSDDDSPDQSKRDTVHREMRPETVPMAAEETRRVSPRRKPRQEHIHQPRSNKADGLACYWATSLQETGALPNRFEEQQIERSFRRWLEMGLTPVTARLMVDAFFADTSLAESEVPWSRFIANAERLRKRVTERLTVKERVYEQDTSQRLADWAREAMEETG